MAVESVSNGSIPWDDSTRNESFMTSMLSPDNNNITLALSQEDQAIVDYYEGISRGLRLYVTPIILFGGTVGNILTIIVVLSRHFRYNPSSIPLITLAFVDIGVLYFNLLDIWLGAMLGDNLQYTRNLNEIGCKLSTFITSFLTQYSSWILVLINFDRVISVYKPLQARTWCSKRRLGLALFMIMIILATVNLHLFWTTIFISDRKTDQCQYDLELLGHHGISWTTVDAALFTFVPFILILGCNVSIIWSLVMTRKRQRANIHVRNALPSDSTTSITTMLITISLVFIITTSPMTVCYQLYDDITENLKDDPIGRALWWELVINTVLVLICYSNNAVNFLLYCISGSKFRCALSDICAGRLDNAYSRRGPFHRGTYRTSIDLLNGMGTAHYTSPLTTKSRSLSSISKHHVHRIESCQMDSADEVEKDGYVNHFAMVTR